VQAHLTVQAEVEQLPLQVSLQIPVQAQRHRENYLILLREHSLEMGLPLDWSRYWWYPDPYPMSDHPKK
jgi:hypothetical protein